MKNLLLALCILSTTVARAQNDLPVGFAIQDSRTPRTAKVRILVFSGDSTAVIRGWRDGRGKHAKLSNVQLKRVDPKTVISYKDYEWEIEWPIWHPAPMPMIHYVDAKESGPCALRSLPPRDLNSICEERGHIKSEVFTETMMGCIDQVHEYADSTVVEHPGCNTRMYTCQRCGQTFTESAPTTYEVIWRRAAKNK